MILHSLKLENVRSYEDETISFPPGTTLFEGDIGSGKSTILMAIEFAQFGLGSQKGASLLRMGAKRGSTTLVFEVDGETYEVHRSLERKPKSVQQGNGYLKSSHGKEHLAPGELKERILGILQFKEPTDPKAQSVIYRYAVFTPQEEMKAILMLKPPVRRQTLRKAFGIEDYKVAAEHALSLSRTIEKKADVLEGRISNLDAKKAELDLKQKDLAENKENLGKLEAVEEELEKNRAEQKEKRNKLREEEKRFKKIEGEVPHLEKQKEDKGTQIAALQGEIEELQKEIDVEIMPEMEELKKVEKPTEKDESAIVVDIERFREQEKKRVELVARLSALKEEVKKLGEKVGDYKDGTVEDIESDINAIERQSKRLSKRIESNTGTLEGIKKEKHALETRIEDIHKSLEDLEGAGSVCPICNRALTDDHRRNLEKERRESISKLEEDLNSKIKLENELNGKISSDEENLEKLGDETRRLGLIKGDLAELINKKGQLLTGQEALKGLEKQMRVEEEEGFPGISKFESPLKYLEALLEQLRKYTSAQSRLKELEKQLTKNQGKIQENQENIKTATAEMELLEKELEKARKELKKLKDVSTNIAKLTGVIEGIEEELVNIRDSISSAKTLIETLTGDIKKLNEEVMGKEEQKALRKKLMDYYHWVRDYFVPTLDNIEKHVMVNINQDFNQHFQRWFNLLVEDVSKDARVDEDFTPIVEQDGYEQDVDFLSGGEKTSVALAYRLALNNIVQKVSTGMKSNLLILDEPTDGFSKEQLFKVREILRELQCPQVVLVSHEKELESFADHVFRVEKSDGKSSVVR